MPTIAELKADRKLQPYFLWYMKSIMPVAYKAHHNGNNLIITDPRVMFNLNESRKALLDQLFQRGVGITEMQRVIEEVTNHLLGVQKARDIMRQAPELLILHKSHRN